MEIVGLQSEPNTTSIGEPGGDEQVEKPSKTFGLWRRGEGGEGVEIFPALSTGGCGGGIDDFCPWPLGKGGVLGTLSAVTVDWDEGVAGVAADGVERESQQAFLLEQV